MGTLLLHDPWVRLYLLYVAALFVACILDCLRNPFAIQDDPRTPRNEVAHGRLAFSPPPRAKPLLGRCRGRGGGWIRKWSPFVETVGSRRQPNPTPAPTSGYTRDNHVFTP
jgi:hypothetical protein